MSETFTVTLDGAMFRRGFYAQNPVVRLPRDPLTGTVEGPSAAPPEARARRYDSIAFAGRRRRATVRAAAASARKQT